MNVYDFDNTIYDGESTVDFFMFCLKKNKKLSKYLKPVIKTATEYKLCLISSEEIEKRCEKYMIEFINEIENPEKLIKEFWDKNENKIKKFYLKQKKDDDIIISASCDILLEEICRRTGIKNLVASKADFEKGKMIYLCHGKNKVSIFKKLYPDAVIDNFYTDSKNDMPMIEISKKAYFVKGDRITEFKK